jgi:hypothetical protein
LCEEEDTGLTGEERHEEDTSHPVISAAANPDPLAQEAAEIRELLQTLATVEISSLYHDVVEKHLDCVLKVLAFLQKHPEKGFLIVRESFEAAQDPLRKGLFVFIGSAARENADALDFFRAVINDHKMDASVRLACARALGMANLPIGDIKAKVRWHYATVLWATGNDLATSHPAAVYSFTGDVRPWPVGVPYEYQGAEDRPSVLQMLMDALWNEPCPRVRYALVQNVCRLNDAQALASFYRRAYETQDWVIPEGHLGAGAIPVRLRLSQLIANNAVESRDPIWLETLKWLEQYESPYNFKEYYGYIVEAYSELGWIDRAFVERALLPWTRPDLGNGRFPAWSDWGARVLEGALQCYSPRELGALFLQVASTSTAYVHKMSPIEWWTFGYCVQEAYQLPTGDEIYRLGLSHALADAREWTAQVIAWRESMSMVPDLVAAYYRETEPEVVKEIKAALEKLAPEVIAGLLERELPKGQSREEQLDFWHGCGMITFEEWQELRFPGRK